MAHRPVRCPEGRDLVRAGARARRRRPSRPARHRSPRPSTDSSAITCRAPARATPCTRHCAAAATSGRPARRPRQQAAAEVRPHHALARRGEQHLLDEVAHVPVVVGRPRCGPGRRRDHGKSSVAAHVATTRGCTTSGSIGVPVGVVTELPVWIATGIPPASTRTAPDEPLPGDARRRGGAGEARSPRRRTASRASPPAARTRSTRGTGAVGRGLPAWAHITVAPRWTIGPGIAPLRPPSARRR